MEKPDLETYIRRFIFNQCDKPTREFIVNDCQIKEDKVLQSIPKEERKRLRVTSKTPIRETLHGMYAYGLGLTQRLRNVGSKAAPPTSRDENEIYFVRLLLEPQFCYRLGQRCENLHERKSIRHELGDIQQRMELRAASLQKEDDSDIRLELAEEFWEIDGEFHRRIAELAFCPLSGIFIQLIRDKLRLISVPQQHVIRNADDYCEQHRAIIDAITQEEYNPVAIDKAVKKHLEAIREFHKKTPHVLSTASEEELKQDAPSESSSTKSPNRKGTGRKKKSSRKKKST